MSTSPKPEAFFLPILGDEGQEEMDLARAILNNKVAEMTAKGGADVDVYFPLLKNSIFDLMENEILRGVAQIDPQLIAIGQVLILAGQGLEGSLKNKGYSLCSCGKCGTTSDDHDA